MQSCLTDGRTARQTSFLRRKLKSRMSSKNPISEPIPVPYTKRIEGDMKPGRSVFIRAKSTPNPKRLNVNFQCDYSEDTDIIFHFDIRFHYLGEYGVVVLNNCKYGCWGERGPVYKPFPFVPGKEFNLEITAESSSYKISVDNIHFADFHYRCPVQTGSVLSICGDVTLYEVD